MVSLSQEQQEFIGFAQLGHNVLVDACIGSGKTTAIQALCNVMVGKRILYLTYNNLLKLDAKNKIKKKGVTVTNYHGFAYGKLKQIGIVPANGEQIQKFLEYKYKLKPICYDVLIIDEYQDIELEIAGMLEFIKECNPDIQVIAVGDMEQKIYDKTTLDVQRFILNFMGDYDRVEFTQCFRLGATLANRLGNIWHKKIVGVNNDFNVTTMGMQEVIDYLSKQNCGDVLCLGTRHGEMSRVFNKLELYYPDVYNKYTAYASIRDGEDKKLSGKDEFENFDISHAAIFTTYDGSKGLERKICVLFDWTDSNWEYRLNQDGQKYEILRNIFCVAASRGKNQVIFVKPNLSDGKLSTFVATKSSYEKPFCVSNMFDFKYKEDINECYGLLELNKLKVENFAKIEVKTNSGFIDLSPCIGILQEQSYFHAYDIDNEIEWYKDSHTNLPKISLDGVDSVEKKVLYLTACDTSQDRYFKQVKVPFVGKDTLDKIHERLGEHLTRDERVQMDGSMTYKEPNSGKTIVIKGRADVVKDDTVYELKFVSELSHEHFLQCACYMCMLKLDKGILWNVKNNEMWEVVVPDKDRFMQYVVKTITKGDVVL